MIKDNFKYLNEVQMSLFSTFFLNNNLIYRNFRMIHNLNLIYSCVQTFTHKLIYGLIESAFSPLIFL